MSTKLTTNAGVPVPDNQNVMTAGARGPLLMQDIGLGARESGLSAMIARLKRSATQSARTEPE